MITIIQITIVLIFFALLVNTLGHPISKTSAQFKISSGYQILHALENQIGVCHGHLSAGK